MRTHLIRSDHFERDTSAAGLTDSEKRAVRTVQAKFAKVQRPGFRVSVKLGRKSISVEIPQASGAPEMLHQVRPLRG